MNALTFNNVNLNPVNNINDGQIWLTSNELAQALGYKSSKSVSNLYNANSDEFTSSMTEVIESVTSSKTKGLTTKTRIFSLRGCHLIAMFARTKIAKQFRKWVLDILEKESCQRQTKLEYAKSSRFVAHIENGGLVLRELADDEFVATLKTLPSLIHESYPYDARVLSQIVLACGQALSSATLKVN